MPPDALTEIYRTQPAARKLFDWIVQAEVEAQRTTVEDLLDNCGVSRRHAINVLRALADAGYGEFKVGRKGHPSRFEWAEDPRVLAERLERGDGRDDDELEQAHDGNGRALGDGELFDALIAQSEPIRAAGDAAWIEHSYVLRPDVRLVVQLPADLSAREAEILSNWIRDLSFER